MKPWNDIDPCWKKAFEQAWQAFLEDTVPIGAAIFNPKGEMMSSAHNSIRMDESKNTITGHTLAHAEINAILKLNEMTNHSDIRTYTLYSTMEPCPLCMGAIIMGSIRNFHFAARDPWAGSAELVDKTAYIKRKNIQATGPVEGLEIFSVAMLIDHEL